MPGELTLDLVRRGIVDVDGVPVLHDVVHDPAHHDGAGVAQQVVRELVLVLGRLVMPEAAIRVGVQAVGREDDVELESSHRLSLARRARCGWTLHKPRVRAWVYRAPMPEISRFYGIIITLNY